MFEKLKHSLFMQLKYLLLISLIISFTARAQQTSARIKVNGIAYTISSNNDRSISIKAKGRVIQYYTAKDLYDVTFSDFKFVDYNGDGCKDILIEYFSNVPDVQDLLLYNKRLKIFTLIKNFPDYPAGIKLKGADLYYSYHRSGCADMNWDSDLYAIKNYKVVPLGTISGREGKNDDEPNGIYIYKDTKAKQKLLKTYNINKLNDFEGDKWAFIADYWKSNYKKFQ